MKASAIVQGKVVRFSLSSGLAAAHRRNRGRQVSEAEVIHVVEMKRREHAHKRMSAYVENRA